MSRPAFAPPLSGAILGFWRWWQGELAATVPARLKRWKAGGEGRLVVLVEEGQATLIEDFAGRRRRLGSIDLAAAQADEVRQILLAARQRTEPRALSVELPAHAALRREIRLPAAAEGNLDEVVSFELERHTPFKRAHVCHAFRILKRDPASRRLSVELTTVPRALIEDALLQLHRLGLDPATVTVAGDGETLPASPNLLRPRAAPPAARGPRRILAALALAAFALAGAAIAVPIYRADREAERLTVAIEAAKQQASESLRLQKEIDAERRDGGFLVARKRQVFTVSRLLDTLTRLLPDDTWLTEFRVDGTDMQIIGLSGSASSIIALIDQTPGFSDAGFRSLVTQDQQIKREQFDIGAHLDERQGQ